AALDEIAAQGTSDVIAPSRPGYRSRFLCLSARLDALTGNHEQIWARIEQSLTILDGRHGTQGLVFALQLATDTALDLEDRSRAAGYLIRLLRIAGETGEWPAVPPGLEAAAELLAPSEPERALGLGNAADALRTSLHITATPRERRRVERWAPA